MDMGIMYGAADDSVSFLVADGNADLIRIAGNASAISIIHEVRIGQTSDAGDAKAEMLPMQVMRYTAAGSGAASSPTAEGLMPGAPTAKATVGVKFVEDAVAGSVGNPFFADAWNIQAGFIWVPTPKARPIVAAVASEGIVFRCDATVQSDLTLQLSIIWEEVIIT